MDMTPLEIDRAKLITAIGAFRYWRDQADCVCHSLLPQGACLRCDIDRALAVVDGISGRLTHKGVGEGDAGLEDDNSTK